MLGQVVLADALSNAVAGGHLIMGSEQLDGPYLGRLRYLTVDEVEEAARQLQSLNYDELNEAEEFDEDIAEEFEAFRQFYVHAADSAKAVVSYFTD
jgi:hypothetical protein